MATQAVSESAIASTFLKELGAPDTDLMRKAVTAWLRKESGSKVIGNNPWNISLGAAKGLGIEPTGFRTHSRTGQKFAVYGSITDGTRAAARLLLRGTKPGDTRGYGGVVNAARLSDPVEFLQSLAKSKWSADRYGGPSNNSLLRVYKSVTGLRNVTGSSAQPKATSGAPPGVTGGATPYLTGFNDLARFPIGHVITEADVNTIMEKMIAAKSFDTGIPIFGVYITGEAREQTRKILSSYVGKTWDKSTQNALQTQFGLAATAAAENALPDPLQGLGKAIRNVSDPGFWARILALLAGVSLVGFGVIRLAKV